MSYDDCLCYIRLVENLDDVLRETRNAEVGLRGHLWSRSLSVATLIHGDNSSARKPGQDGTPVVLLLGQAVQENNR